jgi:hypothetical protein
MPIERTTMAQHTVQTTHIQRLIENGLTLAKQCDGVEAGQQARIPINSWNWGVSKPEHALEKAAADLRHAAEELEAERLSCLGWEQV